MKNSQPNNFAVVIQSKPVAYLTFGIVICLTAWFLKGLFAGMKKAEPLPDVSKIKSPDKKNRL
jgi:hypothetical protein